MTLKDSTVLVLGGWGLVGSAVCRKLLEFEPRKIVIASLYLRDAENEVEDLRKEFLGRPPESFVAWGGNIFTRTEWKDSQRESLLEDSGSRRLLIEDVIGELTNDMLEKQSLYDLIVTVKPDCVVDCINTATAIAYQDIYTSSRNVLNSIDNQTLCAEVAERHLASQYIPQLSRHIQILYRALVDSATTLYIKVGTSGTGGMGLNIPFTHSEERPSRVLLAKAAVAGAQSLLLFLMARTPNGPMVKEVKPSAAIAWKKIEKGILKRKGKPVMQVDMPIANARECLGDFDTLLADGIIDLNEPLEAIYIDTGENGIFSRGEFETISAVGLMELVTPEEIADNVVAEIRGGNTGYDVLAGLDSTVMGPSYRGGAMMASAVEQLRRLEKESGFESIAFEQLGPPRLSKLLFEAHIMKRISKDFRSVLATTTSALSDKAQALIESDSILRKQMLSVGMVVLLADGKKFLRGREVIVPKQRGGDDLSLSKSNVDKWCHEGWVDLRPENFSSWQTRINLILEETMAMEGDSSSRFVHGLSYWNNFEEINEGRIAAWIFQNEDGGERLKR